MIVDEKKLEKLPKKEAELLKTITRVVDGVLRIDDLSIKKLDLSKYSEYKSVIEKISKSRYDVVHFERIVSETPFFINISGMKAKCYLSPMYASRFNPDFFKYRVRYYNPKTSRLEERVLYMFKSYPSLNIFNKRYTVIEIYRGHLPRLFNMLRLKPSQYQFINIESPSPSSLSYLYPFQRELVLDIVKYFRFCGCSTIMVATGGGKTEIALSIISHISKLFPEKPIFILSLNKLLVRQFIERGKLRLNLDIGEVSGESFDIDKQILSSTVQTLFGALKRRYHLKEDKKETTLLRSLGLLSRLDRDESDTFSKRDIFALTDKLYNSSLVVFDEVQHVPAYIAKTTILHSPNSLKLGLSATPWRDDGRSLEIYAYIGDIIKRVTFDDLYRYRVCVPADITFLIYTPPYMRKYYALTDKLPPNKAWHEVAKATVLDENAYYIAAKYITEMQPPILVLVRYIAQGKILNDVLNKIFNFPSEFIYSRHTTKRRFEAIDRLINGHIKALIATTIADEGLDIPQLRSLFLFSSGKSSTRTIQRIGRVVRAYGDKTKGYVYDFVFRLPYFYHHYEVRKHFYKRESSWIIREKNVKPIPVEQPILSSITDFVNLYTTEEETPALGPPDIEEKILMGGGE